MKSECSPWAPLDGFALCPRAEVGVERPPLALPERASIDSKVERFQVVGLSPNLTTKRIRSQRVLMAASMEYLYSDLLRKGRTPLAGSSASHEWKRLG